MKLLKSLLLILIFTGLSLGALNALHKFYVGMTTIDLSRDGNSLECTIKLFRDDLELALAEKEGQKVLFPIGVANANYANLIDSYVDERFLISSGNKKLERTFVGAEVEEEMVWIYIEYKKPLKEFILKNTCLMEMFEDQVNIVHLKQGDNVQSELLNLRQNEAKFTVK